MERQKFTMDELQKHGSIPTKGSSINVTLSLVIEDQPQLLDI